MFLEEYDEELHERTLRREGVEEGRKQGLEQGREEMNELIRAALNDNRQGELLRSLDDRKLQEKLLKEYGIKK